VACSEGVRQELLLVRANLGTQQELGQRIDPASRAMKMPGAGFHSVRAGPHRPAQSGTGESSLDASMIYVVYEARQLYPSYVLEIEMHLAPEVASILSSVTAEALNLGGDGSSSG